MLSVRIPAELDNWLDVFSKENNRSKSYYVKKALLKFMEEKEENRWATESYKEYLDSGKQTISFDDLKKKYGLD
jgi:RHH-type rel operon transcriptional repressor/antitoxin RelB